MYVCTMAVTFAKLMTKFAYFKTSWIYVTLQYQSPLFLHNLWSC